MGLRKERQGVGWGMGQLADKVSHLLGNMLIRVEIEDGGRKAKVESCGLGKQVAWET